MSYYRNEPQIGCDVAVEDQPLVVNCVGQLEIPCGFSTTAKSGRHDFYLMYLVSGELDALVNGFECRIVPGCAVIFPPKHGYRYSKTGQGSVKYLWVHFTGFDAGALLERLGLGCGGVFRVGLDERLSSLFFALMEDFICRDEFFEESTAAGLKTLLISLRRLVLSAEQPKSSLGRLFESISFIHKNYIRPLTNSQLAQIEHLSISQYIELFKKYVGTTPHSYIIELRIRSSCDLLISSDLTVSQIAAAVGYEDAHYFSRLFKLYRGVTPEDYRRNSHGS